MARFLARTVVELVASAIGLIVAAWLLQGVTLNASGFLIAVAVFTVAKIILGPLVFKLSFKYARALTGGIALVTTFVGLLVTTWLTSGLTIAGAGSWVMATIVVWVFTVIAILVLPLVIFKKLLASPGGPGSMLPPTR
jgi:putative membrane protein